MKKRIFILAAIVFFGAVLPGWTADWGGVSEALESARQSNKPIIIKFESDNCCACDKLDEKTLKDPEICKVLESFETAVVDVYDTTTVAVYQGKEYTYRDLTNYFKIKARPTSLFLRPDGTVIDTVRGFIPKQTYVEILNTILSDFASTSEA